MSDGAQGGPIRDAAFLRNAGGRHQARVRSPGEEPRAVSGAAQLRGHDARLRDVARHVGKGASDSAGVVPREGEHGFAGGGIAVAGRYAWRGCGGGAGVGQDRKSGLPKPWFFKASGPERDELIPDNTRPRAGQRDEIILSVTPHIAQEMKAVIGNQRRT